MAWTRNRERLQVVGTTSGKLGSEVPWNGHDLAQAIGFVVAVVFTILAVLVIGAAIRDRTSEPQLSGLFALTVTGAVEGGIFAAVWLFGLRRHHATWQQLGFRSIRWTAILRTVPLTIVIAFLVLSLYALTVRLLRLDWLLPNQVPDSYLRDPASRALLIVLAVGIAPVVEETFFRGFAFTALRHRWKTWRAAGLSSLLFGLAHLAPGLILPTMGLGLLLTLLFRRTGSLWSCVLAHAGFNALSLALAL